MTVFSRLGSPRPPLWKQTGEADSAMDLLIMSSMIGAIVPGSFLIIHVGTG